MQLLDDPVAVTNDLTELRQIHFHLFQDVYDWAGQLRTIDVRKNVPGAEFFLPHGYIETAAANCFLELAEDRFLRGLERTPFVERLAYHYEKINYIHPFREGNGRTQRVFWNRLALQAGWQLDWRPVHGDENHAAARAGSDQLDLAPPSSGCSTRSSQNRTTSERRAGRRWRSGDSPSRLRATPRTVGLVGNGERMRLTLMRCARSRVRTDHYRRPSPDAVAGARITDVLAAGIRMLGMMGM